MPGRILGALPQRKWMKRLQPLGQELLVHLWRQIEENSPATRRRWPWTWVGDDSLVKTYGPQLGWVGRSWSGQEPRVRLGIDGLLLIVVIGEGRLVVPVDLVVRRPDPVGPGHPCRDKLTWLPVRLDRTWTALPRRCRPLPAPLVVADRWFGDSGLMAPVAHASHGILRVEGKRSYVFHLPNGRRVKGHDWLTRPAWPWREDLHLPGMRDVRLTAISPTYGAVTLVIVDAPGKDRDSLLSRATSMTAPRLIRAWRRRRGMEHPFRTLKHLLATETCQVQTEDADSGPLVLRLLAGLVLLYTARVLCKGQVTMEEIVSSLKYHWRVLASERLELEALSWDLHPQTA